MAKLNALYMQSSPFDTMPLLHTVYMKSLLTPESLIRGYVWSLLTYYRFLSSKCDTSLPVHHLSDHSHVKSCFKIKPIRASTSNDSLMETV